MVLITEPSDADSLQVAKRVDGVDYYLHEDALGSVVLTMTASVKPSFSSDYVPYGVNYMATGEEAFQYTGKLPDDATGLYYFGARYYDPSTGRFITEDSASGSTEDPMSLNRYIYARDNPMAIVDPNGHGWNPFGAIASAVTSAAGNVAGGVSTGVSDLAGAATDVGNAVSNAWNSLPPDAQVGVIVGVTAVATIATVGAFAPEAAVVDTSAISAVISSSSVGSLEAGAAATVGIGATVDALPDIEVDAATVASTIYKVILNGALKAVANALDSPGPEESDGGAIGQWGHNVIRPLMRALGFTEEQYQLSTTRGDSYADFYNPVTKDVIDAKTGTGSRDVAQALKYQLLQKAGQISNVYYLNIPNPWTGVNGGTQLANFVAKYGFKVLPLFY